MTPSPQRAAQLRDEARAAAQKYADVNDACPYPFTSWEGRIFRACFLEARATNSFAAPGVV